MPVRPPSKISAKKANFLDRTAPKKVEKRSKMTLFSCCRFNQPLIRRAPEPFLLEKAPGGGSPQGGHFGVPSEGVGGGPPGDLFGDAGTFWSPGGLGGPGGVLGGVWRGPGGVRGVPVPSVLLGLLLAGACLTFAFLVVRMAVPFFGTALAGA